MSSKLNFVYKKIIEYYESMERSLSLNKLFKKINDPC